MKKVIIGVAAVVIIGAGAFGVYHHFFQSDSTSAERVSSDSEDAVYVDQVSTITGYGSGNGLIERFGGEVEPQATLEVELESERTVKECYVQEGDEVQEGDRLFAYDTQEAEDNLAQAQIDIERAQADIEVAQETIASLERQQANASADDQLAYTTEILTQQNEIKTNEYNIQTKELEMQQLQETIDSAVVTAEMGGVIQSISDPNSSSASLDSGSSNAYITILDTGAFRIKGTINEQNLSQIEEGMEMIVYSRVDSSLTWRGTISEINTESPVEEDSSMVYYGGSGADSSSYAFYVELENSDGLILGQHVYMEEDQGQMEEKDGLWLEEYYLFFEDDQAYVWLANESNVIEKRPVTLGEYDEEEMKYEITEGLTQEDYIAMPFDGISEGDPVIYNDFTTDTGNSLDGDLTGDEEILSDEDLMADDTMLSDEDMMVDDGTLSDEDVIYDEDLSSDDGLVFDEGFEVDDGLEDYSDEETDVSEEEYYDADADMVVE